MSGLEEDLAAARAQAQGASSVVLVEGHSDREAVLAMADRHGRDLAAEGVVVAAMGGVTNTGRFAEALGPHGLGLPLSGLYDAAERGDVHRGLLQAGLAGTCSRSGLAASGFHECDANLEDELIRAVGTQRLLELVQAEGEGRGFATFRRQPAQRDRPLHACLHRFIGTRSGRKIRYGRLLVEALGPNPAPEPLEALLHGLGTRVRNADV